MSRNVQLHAPSAARSAPASFFKQGQNRDWITRLLFLAVVYVYPCCHSVSLPQGKVVDVFRFTTFCVQYIGFLVEFVLAFVPDPKPQRGYYHLLDDNEVSPATAVEK